MNLDVHPSTGGQERFEEFEQLVLPDRWRIRMNGYILRGVNSAGAEVAYTGRAGDGWVSADLAEAFEYRTQAEARRKAALFNRNVGLHDLWFVAVPKGGYDDVRV